MRFLRAPSSFRRWAALVVSWLATTTLFERAALADDPRPDVAKSTGEKPDTPETEFTIVPFVGGSSDMGFGGGYVASGEPGWSRVPSPVRRGLSLVRTEAAGEVQTPLRGAAADRVRIGDRVWLRGAKAGELLERFDAVHLVRGNELVETVPSYRGEGRNFG